MREIQFGADLLKSDHIEVGRYGVAHVTAPRGCFRIAVSGNDKLRWYHEHNRPLLFGRGRFYFTTKLK